MKHIILTFENIQLQYTYLTYYIYLFRNIFLIYHLCPNKTTFQNKTQTIVIHYYCQADIKHHPHHPTFTNKRIEFLRKYPLINRKGLSRSNSAQFTALLQPTLKRKIYNHIGMIYQQHGQQIGPFPTEVPLLTNGVAQNDKVLSSQCAHVVASIDWDSFER